jgi:hypothetical protein
MAMHISSYALALKHAAADLLQVCLLKGFLFGRSLLIANKISARPFTLPKKNPLKVLRGQTWISIENEIYWLIYCCSAVLS